MRGGDRLIEESLSFYGIKRQEDVEGLVAAARERSGLGAGEAMDLAVRETATRGGTAIFPGEACKSAPRKLK